jgi:hypothetical protein
VKPRKVQGSRFKVQGSRFKVQGSKFKVQSSRFKVQSSRFKVKVGGTGGLKLRFWRIFMAKGVEDSRPRLSGTG